MRIDATAFLYFHEILVYSAVDGKVGIYLDRFLGQERQIGAWRSSLWSSWTFLDFQSFHERGQVLAVVTGFFGPAEHVTSCLSADVHLFGNFVEGHFQLPDICTDDMALPKRYLWSPSHFDVERSRRVSDCW
jgi:hypothetical protein